LAAFFMTDRLSLHSFQSVADLSAVIASEMSLLGAGTFPVIGANDRPLSNCVQSLFAAGAISAISQRRVFDPDFTAEYTAYYSRQFASIPRTCTRLHFFKSVTTVDASVLSFVDAAISTDYLGFITLRPVARAPVGASILSKAVSAGFVCSSDSFPVNIAGRAFELDGTPFMQQDNAVAVCAQASIWMALRTIRKREGDRAYDPAQITDAATRYFINGRTRPNKGGLTIQQMAEAVRAAGYSPHAMPLGPVKPGNTTTLTPLELEAARRDLHAYIESEIPVLLALFHPSGGHAIAAIGHTWNATPGKSDWVYLTAKKNGATLKVKHAISWVPEFIVHNDNTGPYRKLPSQVQASGYSLSCAAIAIPLLPADVYMTGEEARICGMGVLLDIMEGLKKQKKPDEVDAIAKTLVIRVHLAEKRKLRLWATTTPMVQELKDWLRTGDLPKRVWVFEVHTEANYGLHGTANQATLVGLVLIDPTGDALDANILMFQFNFPAIAGSPEGVMVTYDPTLTAVQTKDLGPIMPIRR
jgi:hypothetical protein